MKLNNKFILGILIFLFVIVSLSFLFASPVFTLIPEDTVSITNNFVLLNTTITNITDGTVYIFASDNETYLDLANGLVYIEEDVDDGEEVTYNFTAMPIKSDDEGLVALWHFDNRSEYGEFNSAPSLVYDFAGGDNNLSNSSSTSMDDVCDLPEFNITAGKFGGAYEFNGINESFHGKASQVFNMTENNELTISSWVYIKGNPSSGKNANITSIFSVFYGGWVNFGQAFGYLLGYDDNSNFVFLVISATTDLTYPFSHNQWYHVAATYNGSDASLYVNGVIVNSSVMNVDLLYNKPGGNNADYVSVGASLQEDIAFDKNSYFNGTIDELAVWNRSLSETEILNQYRLKEDTYYWKVNATNLSHSGLSDVYQFYLAECNSSSKYSNGSDCSYRGDRSFNASVDDSTQYYWLDMPDNFNSSETYPLIVNLHPLGGDRMSYTTSTSVSVGLMKNYSRTQGWIVVSPDYRGDSWMNSTARSDVTDIINEMKNDFNINESRVHAYGISMGAGAALTYAKYNPTIIASVTSIYGVTNFTLFYYVDTIASRNNNINQSLIDAFGGTPTEVPEIYDGNSVLGNEAFFRNVSVQMFHGNGDGVIHVNHSRDFNASLSALNYSVDYTEVTTLGYHVADNIMLPDSNWQKMFDFFLNNTKNIVNDIYSCQELNSSGTYYLTKNLENSEINSTGCFNITAPNVVLDCQNYYIKNMTLAKPGIYSNQINTTIKNCNVTMSSYGAYYANVDEGIGIYLKGADNSTILNNILTSQYYALYIHSTPNSLIQNNTFVSNTHNIFLAYSNNSNIIDNSFNNSDYFKTVSVNSPKFGIHLYLSENNLIENNTFFALYRGVFIESNNNVINSNVFNGNGNGFAINIYPGYFNNTITRNILDFSFYGILLFSSELNTISLNNMSQNNHNLQITYNQEGPSSMSNITLDNLVDGKKIYYNYSISNYVYDLNSAPDAGMIICVHCTNITIKDLNLSSNNGVGIHFYNTTKSLILNNTITNNFDGILLKKNSDYNQIINNTLISNVFGVDLINSSNNNITSNNIEFQDKGISFEEQSLNNILTLNTFQYSYQGVYIESGSTILSSQNNTLKNNLNPNYIINSTLNLESIERTYEKDSEIIFNVSMFYLNKSSCSSCYYNISIYPNESYVITKNNNELEINFTPTKNGLYSVVINVTTPENDVGNFKYIFLAGNTSLDTLRYYFHGDEEPINGQSVLTGGKDTGTMLTSAPTHPEFIMCYHSLWFQIDEIAKPLYIIKNISWGWWYRNGGGSTNAIERFANYKDEANLEYNIDVPEATTYVWNTTSFSDLNLTSDYLFRNYWFALNLNGSRSFPYVKTNSTNWSYVDLDYIYAGPKIDQLTEELGSDLRKMKLLSSYFEDDSKTNATIQLDGEGNFTIAVEMPNSNNYKVYYDDVLCSSNSDCIENNLENTLVNFTISLSSGHEIQVVTSSLIEEINSDPSSSPGGGIATPSFWKNTFVINDEQFTEGVTKQLQKTHRMKIKVNNEFHHVGVVDLTETEATINISSETIQVKLNVGEDAKVDVTGDNFYDVYVILNNILISNETQDKVPKANITIKNIHEEIPKESDSPIETTGEVTGEEIIEESKNIIPIVIGAIVLILILILAGIVIYRKR
jgi:parallel beta-helix repeat protein